MNLQQILKESTGLTNRRTGEIFKNPETSEEIQFQDLRFFPEQGSYDEPSSMAAAIQDLESRIGKPIQWVNTSRASGAFGVAYFEGADGPVYFGRYFAKIKPSFKDNYWDNGDLLGFKLSSAASEKSRTGYYPNEVLSNLRDQTPEQILLQVQTKFGLDHPLTGITRSLVEGQSLPLSMPKDDIDFTAFRDIYCEILQPIALIRGQFTGNALSAEDIFLGGANYSDCTITFNTLKNVGLYDSVLTATNGRTVRLSSKGGFGAKAAASNLLESSKEIMNSANSSILDSYRQEIDILRVITEKSYIEGPLDLGTRFGIIDDSEAVTIRQYLQDPKAKLGITDNLKQLILHRSRLSRDTKDIHQGYTLLAAVAHRVCEYINLETNFGQAATTILNNGALIQVYTKSAVRGNDIVLDNFNTVFPSQAATDVSISAQKTYYNTGNNGKLTFIISSL